MRKQEKLRYWRRYKRYLEKLLKKVTRHIFELNK